MHVCVVCVPVCVPNTMLGTGSKREMSLESPHRTWMRRHQCLWLTILLGTLAMFIVGNRFNNRLSQQGNRSFALSNFHGVNISNKADFNLPTWHHWAPTPQ